MYALQNCVSWVAFDVGGIGSLRIAAHELIARVSCASDDIVVGSKPAESLNHKVISPVLAR